MWVRDQLEHARNDNFDYNNHPEFDIAEIKDFIEKLVESKLAQGYTKNEEPLQKQEPMDLNMEKFY